MGLEDVDQATGRLLSTQSEPPKSNKLKFRVGDVLFGRLRPNLNKGWLADFDGICSTDFVAFRPSIDRVLALYFLTILQSKIVNTEILTGISGSSLPRVSTEHLKNIEIPLPPIETQEQFVTDFEREQEIIEANRQLIDLMTTKIANTLAEI